MRRKNLGGLLLLAIAAFTLVKTNVVVPHGNGSLAGYVNPIGKGLIPDRIDQGVDYDGAGNLYALGAGTVVMTRNPGWPGGVYISLHLAGGTYKGRYVYYAESITTDVSPGERVHAGQLLGHATGCRKCGIEIGWAAPPGTGPSMAMTTGETSAGLKAGDAGKYPTKYGVEFSDLIKALGGPPGLMSGKPVQE